MTDQPQEITDYESLKEIPTFLRRQLKENDMQAKPETKHRKTRVKVELPGHVGEDMISGMEFDRLCQVRDSLLTDLESVEEKKLQLRAVRAEIRRKA